MDAFGGGTCIIRALLSYHSSVLSADRFPLYLALFYRTGRQSTQGCDQLLERRLSLLCLRRKVIQHVNILRSLHIA